MRAAQKGGELWSTCIEGTSRFALVAAAGQPLHIFTWRVGNLALILLGYLALVFFFHPED